MWKLKCKFRKTLQLVTRPPPLPSKDLSLVLVDLLNIRSIYACCALEPAIEARCKAFRCSSGPKLKLYGPRRRSAISPADRTGASSRAHKPPVDQLYRYRQLSHLVAGTWDNSPAPYFIETETFGIKARSARSTFVTFRLHLSSSIVPLKFHPPVTALDSLYPLSTVPQAGYDTHTSIAYPRALFTIALRRHQHLPIFGDG